MKGLYITLTSILFMVLQTAVAGRIAFGEVTPDFTLLLVVFFALYKGKMPGAVFGFVIGILQDLFNPGFLGLNAMTKSILGYTVGHVGARTFPENILFLFGLFFSVAFGHDAMYLVFFTWPDTGSFFSTLFGVALPSALYTATFGVVIHKLFTLVGAKAVNSLGKEG